ncbi:MAG TPA: MFS transporter [Gemmatimonadaceae bacterium]|nr:MFS transporter [Gemmatimonadaceae bacterium]
MSEQIPDVPSEKRGLLWRLGLHRPELRAWTMYDWANSAFVTTIMTAVFPIYYSRIASAGLPPETASFRYGISTTIGLIIIAVISPILGTIADYRPVKKRLLGTFMGVGVTACILMYFVQRGDWLLASLLFIVANFGANGSFVFYDSLLPHIARDDEMDRVSTAGYALGYIGGGLHLAIALVWIQKPEWFGLPQSTLPTRLAFASVGIWWLAFAIPLFRRVHEPAPRLEPDEQRGQNAMRIALERLKETFGELRQYRNAFLMLVAFFIYNDGIGTIIRMATIYGTEIGIEQGALIRAILIVQFVGVPFAFLFGTLAGRLGTKRSIYLALVVYTGISILGYFMRTATHFLILAVLVGMVQGGAQALSRSLFASLIPRYKSGEFFGFFAVMEKFAGILGPAVFALTIGLTGSSRNAILTIIAFFAIGGYLLSKVDVEEGQRIARDADAKTLAA